MPQINQLTLNSIPWDWWDKTKPTLWQISYLSQLIEQTGIEVDTPNTRSECTEAITALLNERKRKRMANRRARQTVEVTNPLRR